MFTQSLVVLKTFGLAMALVGLVASSPASAAPQSAGPEAAPAGTEWATPAGPSTPLIGCGASANDVWTNATGTYSTIRECSLTVPEDGQVFISADGTVMDDTDISRLEFDVSIDSTSSGLGAKRWVDARTDWNGGQHASLARTAMAPLGTGSHTIRLLGKSYSPPTTVTVEDASLSAIFIPDSSDLMTCHDDDSTWSTSSNTYSTILKCSLDVPEDGWAFVTSDASVRWQELGQDLELAFEFDSATGPESATRLVGAHSGSWSFSSAALSVLKSVSRGDRTFAIVGRRADGTGQIDVYSPSFNVIYIPSSSAYAIACGKSNVNTWSHDSDTWREISKCSLQVPTDAWAFVSASSSVTYADDLYLGEFQVRIDEDALKSTSHEVSVYDTDDFGRDKTVAVSLLKPIAAGQHTFNFRGRQSAGLGTVSLTHPTLTAIVPLTTLAKPVLNSPEDGATLCNGQPTLTWTAVEGATSHRVHVDDDPAFGSIALDETVMDTSYTLTAAQELSDGVYYWRVRGSSPVQTGPWSATSSFTVGIPTAPILQSPADGATIGDLTPEFSWSSVAGSTEYRLRVGLDPAFSSVVLDVNVPGTSHTPAANMATDSYHWSVQAHTPCGWSDWSATWQVTIEMPGQVYLPLLQRDWVR
jgi:hypothetical protein